MIRLIAIIGILTLSACGFTPMYGEHSNATPKQSFNKIAISIIPDREGQYLRNALIDRFYTNGIPSNPTYQLTIDPIKESISDFDITIESEATRRQLKLTSTMRIVDIQTNKTILTQSILATSSHNVLTSEFSTLVTEQSARDAALNDLARQVERQVALYFSR